MTLLFRGLGLLLLLCALGGCAVQRASVSGLPSLADRAAPIELADTPFHPQEALNCGPAALATVLGAAGHAADPEALVREVYTPGLGGSLQLELVAAARARGFLPYVIAPDPDALAAELVVGRPVLVLQNLRLRTLPAWHYAVVIGADPLAEQYLLRSGTERRLEVSARRFMRSWDRAERWGLVLLEPGDLPAKPDRARYFDAVAGLEETGRYAAAARAWEAGLVAWPGDPIALFGLATALYFEGDLAGARVMYEALVADAPDHAAALNNLAHVLKDAGCAGSARVMAARAADAARPGSAIAAVAAETLAGLPADATDGEGGADACGVMPAVYPDSP